MEAKNFREGLQNVRAFAFDLDGVLSSSEIVVDEQGEMYRKANTRDGFALQLAVRAGYPIAIITGCVHEGVRRRYSSIGINDIYLGVRNKAEALEDFCTTRGVSQARVLYMGDDLPDYEAMQRVGMPTCPLDAIAEIQRVAKYVSPFGGGAGCVRDVVEQVMRLQGKWVEDGAGCQRQ